MADETVTAGRGVLYIAVAKLYFMMAGYAIYFVLPRLLHDEAQWGDYLVVIGLVSVIDNVLVTATIQAVSKFTAQQEAHAEAVKRAGLQVQLILGVGLAALYVVGAPWVARWERDASLTNLYRLSAGIMLCYAFYSVFVGSLNGLRRFGRQAALDMTFATLRMAAILSAAAMGMGVAGAIGGFVAAAVVILVVSALWVGLPRGTTRFAVRELWSFMAQLFVYTLALNLIMRVDLFLVKRFAAELSGAAAAEAAKVASAYAGYYGTAQSLAFIPYQAILAVAFVVFPLVSRSTFENDLKTTQSYVRQTLRLSLIFVVGVAVVFMANPEAVINVVYQSKYRIGGPALRVLSLGMICFSMFTIINTILNGAGRTGQAIISGVVTLAAASAANYVLIPRAATPESALFIAAAATASAMALGMIISAIFVYKDFSALIPSLSVVRVVIAGVVALVVGHFVPERSKLFTLAECVVVVAVYVVVLIVLREFSADDVARFRRVLRRS
jgi:O-antigen/teichoic acid export membrane protein